MATRRALSLLVTVGLTSALAFGQVAELPDSAQTQASPARVLAGVRDFTPDALQGMAVLADNRDWLEMAAKAIQAGGKPDLGNPDMPAAVKDALQTFSDVPELILLLAARPDELATLRDIQKEAPEGVALKTKQLRADYSYARREGAIAWQRLLQSDPVALGQYREYLTKFCEQQQKITPGFAVVRVTDRDYYLASPPDDAIMTYAHEAGPPEALGKLMARWWDDYGTEAVDDAVAERSLDARPSVLSGSVIDMPKNRRATMWKPLDEKSIETVGLMPVILQPFEDQPDGAKVATAVQELARVWSLGEGAPASGPVAGAQEPQPAQAPVAQAPIGQAPVAQAPVAQAPVEAPAALPEAPIDDLAAQADAYGPYTVLSPRYAWPGITTYGLSSYGGFCYVPYSGYISNYTYVNGYPYWYCPPPNCGTTYMYFPQCRPTFSYLRDPYQHGSGLSFGLHTGGSYFGLNIGDRDCRRYGVYQYGGHYGRDWGRDWSGYSAGQYSGVSGYALKERPIHRAPFAADRGGRGGRGGALDNGVNSHNDGRPDDGRRNDDRRGGGFGDIGHRPWNSNSWGRSNNGNRDGLNRQNGDRTGGRGIRNNGSAAPTPRAMPGARATPTPRALPTPARPSIAPRQDVAPRPGTGGRSSWFTPRRDTGGQRSNSVAPQPARREAARGSVFDRLQSARQNWNARPSSPAGNFGSRTQSAPRQSGSRPGIADRIRQHRQNNQGQRGPR